MAPPVEIVIGRTLACCTHPYLAWRRGTAAGRCRLVLTYFAAAYGGVLAVLVLF